MDYEIKINIARIANYLDLNSQDSVLNIFNLGKNNKDFVNNILFQYKQRKSQVESEFIQQQESVAVSDPISIIVFAMCILLCVLFLLSFYQLVLYVNQKTEKLLLLFLDIPRKNLQEIYK